MTAIEQTTSDPAMKAALIASIVLHVGAFLVATFGLPKRDVEPYKIIPITIEQVKIDEKSQTPEPAQPKPPPAKKMDAETPPDLLKSKPVEKPELKEDTPPVKKVPPKPEPVPDPAQKPKPPIVKKEEPKPEPNQEEVTKTEKEKPAQDFSSILKNLTPDEDEQKNTPQPSDAPEKENGESAPSGPQLSLSEIDAIQQQIYPCWNISSGTKYAENLIITIKMTMNKDGSMQDARILNPSNDPSVRAAAESAMRALRNPRCTPLKLPQDKYNHWKTITLNFDPSGVL